MKRMPEKNQCFVGANRPARPLAVQARSNGDVRRSCGPLMLVAVDVNENPEGLLAGALDLAGRLGSRVTVVHVVPHTRFETMMHEPERKQYRRDLVRSAQQKLHQLKNTLKPTVPMTSIVADGGVPEFEILRIAESLGAGLVVIGAPRPGVVRRWIEGEVGTAVLKGSRCPVVTIPCEPLVPR